MKIFSISSLDKLLSSQPVKTELVASSEGKSLVLVNGRPVQLDADISAQVKNATLALRSQAVGNPEAILNQAGLESNEQNLQLLEALRQFGVPLTPENAKKAVVAAAMLPEFALSHKALSAVVLLILRRLPLEATPLLYNYLLGKLKYAQIFSENQELGLLMRTNARFANVFQLLQQMIDKRDKIEHPLKHIGSEAGEKLAQNLMLQELLTEVGSSSHESRVYFQWPLFWANQPLPDTLEGEAFFMPGDKEQGFCLRLLVEPPTLGKMEIALNQLNNTLWVHFGAASEVLADIRSIFPMLSARLEAEGFSNVRLTVGKLRKIENFLLESYDDKPKWADKTHKLDLKV